MRKQLQYIMIAILITFVTSALLCVIVAYRGQTNQATYHITCWSNGTKTYEGEGTDIGERFSSHRIEFYDEDGQDTVVYGDCVIEQNIDRSKLK